jgi:hypothetical protein
MTKAIIVELALEGGARAINTFAKIFKMCMGKPA